MKAIVCGLGHLGSVTVACLLQRGHKVVGFDIDDTKTEQIGRGLAPVDEPGITFPIAAGKKAGQLTTTKDLSGQSDADIAIICVGTPESVDGSPDITAIKVAAESLGHAVAGRSARNVPMPLVFRSTMPPGTMSDIILSTLINAAGEAPGRRYEPICNPDFSREGSAVVDYFNPPKIVIGEREPGAAGTLSALSALYAGIEGPRFITTFSAAELAKYTDNAFHSLKVAFANEIGRIALGSKVSPSELFDIFLADTKLNLSAAYLRPGAPFGGPCLRKDVRALVAHAGAVNVVTPVIDSILDSNAMHSLFLVTEIERRVASPGRILLLGLTFKAGSGDLRDSPNVDLALALVQRGHEIAIYDPDLLECTLETWPANLPRTRVWSTMPPIDDWDLIVIAKNDPRMTCSIGSEARVFNIESL